eukprot:CAMPEP_0198254096 /NCGR_PEP_ID=MMETSP1447-20131203/4465_1 /TAXON_ID=420782 /ORGANISM="Chaetoceros dichaeta, Strain CCMP1751" /LENGTH=633 /DNA_ID=CAMNT_0043940029 /DNA_START=113 /DNA_END=2014 /DNA_ORIENTATION=-
MPQPSMQQEQESSTIRSKHSKGITMEDLKYQTAARLAQEQSRRAITFASNRKPATSAIPLSSPSSQYNKEHDNKLRSICDTELNIPSIERQNISQNHHISNHIRKSRQQHNSAQRMRYMLNPLEPVTHLNENRRDGVDGNRDMAPSEQFQQHVNHHYHSPRHSICHSPEVKPQLTVVPSSTYKRQTCTKTYRHGLTVQELKEMTRSRLAAESNGDNRTDKGLSIKSKSTFSKDPVCRTDRDTTLLQNIRERLRLNSSGSISPSHSGFSCETNANQDDKIKQFENGCMYQPAQQHTFLHHSPPFRAQDPTTLTERHHDHLLAIHSSYSNDAYDNNSDHSLNSGIESEYHGSEQVSYPSGYLRHRSASYPIPADFGGAPENRDPRRNPNLFGASSFGISDCSLRRCSTNDESSPYAPMMALQKNDSFLSSSDSLVSSHSFPRVENPVGSTDGFYCGIIGQGSSETQPTVNLSHSHCGSEENSIAPLNFGASDRNVSDGVISRNGDLPNSVAESVFSPPTFSSQTKRNPFSGVFRDSNVGHHNTHNGRYSKNQPCKSPLQPTNSGDNIFCRKSWDESDDVSKSNNCNSDPNYFAKFLDDVDLRLSFNSSPEVPSSSFFVSKIDPEVMKHNGYHVSK